MLDKDIADVTLEALVVPAEPAAELRWIGQRAPDHIPWRRDGHLDVNARSSLLMSSPVWVPDGRR